MTAGIEPKAKAAGSAKEEPAETKAAEPAETEPATLLELHDIGKTYPGPAGTKALSQVSLEIADGDFVSITGPSGSGKSSLLNVLGLLDGAGSGSYRIRGEPVEKLTPRRTDALRSRTFGFVFQSSPVVAGRSVAKNVEVPLAIVGTPTGERPALVQAALHRVGIAHKAGDAATLLSGGERQRLAIARALVHQPDVLLLDEPTGNLDSKNTSQVIDLLKELNASGTTIVLVTHDPVLAEAATRHLMVEDGRVREAVAHVLPPARADSPPMQGGEGVPAGRAAAEMAAPSRRRLGTRALDAFSDAVYGIVARPLRTLLLVAVIVLSSGGLVAAQGISRSAADQVSDLLTAAALDEVFASSSADNGLDAGPPFTAAQLGRALKLDGVTGGGLETRDISDIPLSRLAPSSVETRSRGAMRGEVRGADAGVLRADGAVVDNPSAPHLLDGPLADHVALVGAKLAEKLSISAAEPGVKVWLAGRPFDVVGIVTETEIEPQLLDSVIVANGALASRVGSVTRSTMFLRTLPGLSHNVGEALPYAIDAAHPNRTKVQSLADLGSIRAGVDSQLGGLVLLMALVLLGLAVLATAAVMAGAVLSRKAEIGLRRAMGASSAATARLFVLEGAALGAAGGLVGASGGVLATLAACASQHWTPTVSVTTTLTGIAVGVLVGAVSTIVPALQAGRVQPALALRD